jgi:hypothetical protein
VCASKEIDGDAGGRPALARLTAAPFIGGVIVTPLRRTGQETIHDQALDRAE